MFDYLPNATSRSSGWVFPTEDTHEVVVGTNARYSAVHSESDEFSEYELYNVPDWDGFGAQPITAEVVKTARRFSKILDRAIMRPDIAPGANGTIGFEWRTMSPESLVFVEVSDGAFTALREVGKVTQQWPQQPLRDVYMLLPELRLPRDEPA